MRRLIKIQLVMILGIGAIVVLVWIAGKALSFGRPARVPEPVNSDFINRAMNPMKFSSPAFGNQQSIPSKYTCDGDSINPPLSINDVPSTAKSLALIVDDPDAPMGTWVHWTMWNIDPKITEIGENSVSVGAVQGLTSSNKNVYGPPCPPSGTHRYFFKLYALDTLLDLPSNSDKAALEAAMQGHVLESAELMGTYQRKK